VLLQAAASPRGPARAVIDAVGAGHLELLLCGPILTELADVLCRVPVRRRFPLLDDSYVEEFLTRLVAIAKWHTDPVPVFKVVRDPKDEPYLNLAVAAGAHYLITRDRDLLDLTLGDDAEELARIAPELRILDPVALLQEFRLKRESR
jgi:putative PIN family toxin of toxin-antitoxin system